MYSDYPPSQTDTAPHTSHDSRDYDDRRSTERTDGEIADTQYGQGLSSPLGLTLWAEEGGQKICAVPRLWNSF